jgi:hypothetical protein
MGDDDEREPWRRLIVASLAFLALAAVVIAVLAMFGFG